MTAADRQTPCLCRAEMLFMAVIVFQHHPNEGPAVLGSVLHSYGHRFRVIRLYQGDAVPSQLDEVDGVISMGGPMDVDQGDQYAWMAEEKQYLKTAHDAGVPIVGICLGAQLIASALGGEVEKMPSAEIGWYPTTLSFGGTTDPIYSGIAWQSHQFHVHGQEVTQLPNGAVCLASSEKCKNQAFRVGLTTYGFQYHFEWNRQDLEMVVRDPFIASAGCLGDEILHQLNDHYDSYRRLGDRLCHTIAMNLFPINQRRF